MEDFADVAIARESFKRYLEAVSKGREIIQRAGVKEPPPLPDFDIVFKRLTPVAKAALYQQIRGSNDQTLQGALKIWQPLLRSAFGSKSGRGGA